jgi:alanine racemase
MEYPLVKACINLDAIARNIACLKNMTGPDVMFMAVVKADAYGHGAVQTACKALETGADWLGVARLDEALELRHAGIDAPVLVFGYIHPGQVTIACDLDIIVSVYDFDMARALSCQAEACGRKLRVHLKIDTGMGRVGVIVPDETVFDMIQHMARLPGIDLEGIYTHFAAADHEDKTYAMMQAERFVSLVEGLEARGVFFRVRHAANSAAIMSLPESHFDMVRAGIAMYGLYPGPSMKKSEIELIPAMELKSIISSVKEVPKGFFVSYGMTYETEKPTRLASVPIGYADGFSRLFSSNGYMLVNGCRAPVAGRVCMDQTMLDVGSIPGVAPGDEVVIMGAQKGMIIGADELAARINTINYEIVSGLTSRVKRVYSDSGSG